MIHFANKWRNGVISAIRLAWNHETTKTSHHMSFTRLDEFHTVRRGFAERGPSKKLPRTCETYAHSTYFAFACASCVSKLLEFFKIPFRGLFAKLSAIVPRTVKLVFGWFDRRARANASTDRPASARQIETAEFSFRGNFVMRACINTRVESVRCIIINIRHGVQFRRVTCAMRQVIFWHDPRAHARGLYLAASRLNFSALLTPVWCGCSCALLSDFFL